jgi:hypothetical protein
MSKDVAWIFVHSLFFIVQKRVPLGGEPFAIGGVDMVKPEFAEYFDKTAILYSLAEGFPKGFEKAVNGDEWGIVLQGLFISEAEHDFLKRQGSDALLEKLKSQRAEINSLRRPSCA